MAMQVSVIQKQILKDSKNINSFSESLKKLFVQGHIFKPTFWKLLLLLAHNPVASLPFFDVVIANSLVVQILSTVDFFSCLLFHLPDLIVKCVCCTVWS